MAQDWADVNPSVAVTDAVGKRVEAHVLYSSIYSPYQHEPCAGVQRPKRNCDALVGSEAGAAASMVEDRGDENEDRDDS